MAKNKDKDELNANFIDACENGDLSRVKYLLTSAIAQEHADIHADHDEAFRGACRNGHLEVVKYLLTSPELKEHADIHLSGDYGFRWACHNGHLELVKYLTVSPDLKDHANIHAGNDCGFMWACMNGHLGVVQHLINENDSYRADSIGNIDFYMDSPISKNDVIEIIKARDLKNQILNEVSLKNKPPRIKTQTL